MSNSLWPHELQHIRLPCPSTSPRVCSNSCPLSWWCHPAISSSLFPFSPCPQSSSPSGSFPMSHSSHQVAKVLELQTQHQSFQWVFRVDFPLGWTGWSPCCPRNSQEPSTAPHSKASILHHSTFFMAQLSHPYMTTGKTIAVTIWTFVGKVMSLLFNTLSRFVIAFLPRSKSLLILWMQSPSAVILECKKIKSVTTSTFPSSICHEVMEPDVKIFVFECWVLSQLFHSPFSLSSRSSHFTFCH